jgi:biopolymer transport protein ExbB
MLIAFARAQRAAQPVAAAAAERLSWAKDDNVDALQPRAPGNRQSRTRARRVRHRRHRAAARLVGTIVGSDERLPRVSARWARPKRQTRAGHLTILVTTLAGLLIAIPSLIFWSYYTKKVEMLTVEMETLCDEFVRRQYRELPDSAPASAPPALPRREKAAATEG